MSKELLKALVDGLDDLILRKNLSEDDALNISDSVLVRAEKAIENYLTQPELSTDSLQLDEQDLREDLREDPMAWMWTRNYEEGGYTNMVFQMKCEADEYAKDSESLKRPDLVRPLYLGVEND